MSVSVLFMDHGMLCWFQGLYDLSASCKYIHKSTLKFNSVLESQTHHGQTASVFRRTITHLGDGVVWRLARWLWST